MIAKYPGRCRYCGKPIEVGRDEYDIETKTSYHVECHENPKPTPECYAIADRCGFVPAGDVERTSFVALGEQWSALRRVPSADRDATSRPARDNQRRPSGI